MPVCIIGIVTITFKLTGTKLILSEKNSVFPVIRGLACKFCFGLENNQIA